MSASVPGRKYAAATPPDASPHRSADGSAKSSNDPVPPARGPVAESSGPPANPPRATRCPAPNRSLRNIRPATTGSSDPAPGSGGPTPARKRFGRPLLRTRRSRRHPATRSIACRRDAPVRPADPTVAIHNGGCSGSRVPIAMRHSVRAALDPVDPFANKMRLSIDFHHRLLAFSFCSCEASSFSK